MDSDGVGQMNSQPMRELVHRRGDYGIDAPYILSGLVTVGAVLLIAAAISLWIFHMPGVATGCLVGAALTFASAASYFYTTRHGKFVVWAQLLSGGAPW
jgi:hypothetical protein